MSIATMVDHPLIAAAIADEGLVFMGIEERLEAGQSFNYGGAPREGLIMNVSVAAQDNGITLRYLTQQEVKVVVEVRLSGEATVTLSQIPPETYVNAASGQPLSDVIVLPGGAGLMVQTAEVTDKGLTLSVA